jgi:hypothetical protein
MLQSALQLRPTCWTYRVFGSSMQPPLPFRQQAQECRNLRLNHSGKIYAASLARWEARVCQMSLMAVSENAKKVCSGA